MDDHGFDFYYLLKYSIIQIDVLVVNFCRIS